MFYEFKSWIDYFIYMLSNRQKLITSTLLTLISLILTFLSIPASSLDLFTWIGLLGTIVGGILTINDIKELREEVENIDIAPQYNITSINLLNTNKTTKIGERFYLIDETVNSGILKGSLKKSVKSDGRYELSADARNFGGISAFSLLSYFRSGKFHSQTAYKARIPVWNDKKIRLNTSPSDFLSKNPFKILTTSYYDYISAGFFTLREMTLHGNTVRQGNELIIGKGKPNAKWTIADITEAKTAHHIGINLLLIDKNHRILYQKRNLSPGKVGNCAPSGSGSLDFIDINKTSFEETIINGALREFREETGWDKTVNNRIQKSAHFLSRPIGLSIDLTRGMVTDFFVLAYTQACIKDFIDSSKNKHNYDTFEIGKNSIDFFEFSAENEDEFKKSIDKILDDPEVRSSAMLDIALNFFKSAVLQDENLKKQISLGQVV